MNPDALSADGAPRYQQLSTLLAREIRDGRHPVGSLLPPEPQLCERFGVSRHTLREAVRKLCEQGLVTRHQGIGTRVKAASAPPQRYLASLGSLAGADAVHAADAAQTPGAPPRGGRCGAGAPAALRAR